MIALPRHLLGWIVSAFGSPERLILENLALRQQLLALHAKRPRRRLTALHKLFWVVLRRFWSGWKKPLILPRSTILPCRDGLWGRDQPLSTSSSKDTSKGREVYPNIPTQVTFQSFNCARNILTNYWSRRNDRSTAIKMAIPRYVRAYDSSDG